MLKATAFAAISTLVIGLVAFTATVSNESDAATIQSKTVKIGVVEVSEDYVLRRKNGKFFIRKEKVKRTITGSGSIISPNGTILTCAHLFDGLETLKIFVKTSSGQTYLARVVRVDQKLDLAILDIKANTELPYFRIGRSVAMIGDHIIAAGSPLGMQHTITYGQVSNMNPERTGRSLMHTAPIAPGNSGGPLLDAYGRLIGVNVRMYMMSPFAPAPGTFIAVNLATIKDFIRE